MGYRELAMVELVMGDFIDAINAMASDFIDVIHAMASDFIDVIHAMASDFIDVINAMASDFIDVINAITRNGRHKLMLQFVWRNHAPLRQQRSIFSRSMTSRSIS
jgi:hypothetical protein